MQRQFPIPRLILNITSKETDSVKKLGNPEPHAEIVNRNAEIIKEFFLPILMLRGPAIIAPTKQPINALPTTNPCNVASSSKYLVR